MKKLLFFLVVIIIILGCKDIIVSPPTDLRGVYKGTYERIKNYSSGSGERIRHDQYVEWTFTDLRFYCDATDTTLKPRFTCDFYGNYELTDKIVLKDTVVKAQTCNHDDIPIGEFTRRSKENPGGEDSLIIEQLDVKKDVYKAIRVVKIH